MHSGVLLNIIMPVFQFFKGKSTTSNCNYINYIKLDFFFLVGLVEFISLRSIWACALCLLSSSISLDLTKEMTEILKKGLWYI